MSPLRRHLVLLPLLLLPLLLMWRPIFAGETYYFEDLAAFYFPREQLLARSGLAGWNPHVVLGLPLAGDPQTAAFEPVRAACRGLGLELTTSFLLFLGIYFLIATVGVYLLALGKGASPPAAALSVMAAVWGATLVMRIRHPWVIPMLSLIPWVMVCADRLLAKPRLEWGLAIGLLLAWGAAGGHPQPTYITGLFVGIYLAAGALLSKGTGERGGRLPALWAVEWRAGAGLIAMAGLSAAGYAPTLSAQLQSARSTHGIWYSGSYSWNPWDWLRLLAPDLYGNDLAGTYFATNNYHEFLVYIGVTPLLLFGLTLGWRERRRERRHLIGMSLGSALLAAGVYGPLFYLFWVGVPGFRLFRAPCRYSWLAALCAALVAGLALGDIAASRRPAQHEAARLARWTRSVCMWPSLIALLVAAVALAWPGLDALGAIDRPGAHLSIAWAAARAAILIALSGALVVAWLEGRREGPRTATLLIALTALDLALQWLPYRQTLPLQQAWPSPVVTEALSAAAPGRVLVHLYGEHGEPQITPLVNWGEAAGYDNVRGYNQGVSGEVLDLFATGDLAAPGQQSGELPVLRMPADWLLDLLGVRRIVARAGKWPAAWQSLPLVAAADGLEVRERPHPMARAWLVAAAEPLAGSAALARLSSLDLRRSATVDREVDLPAATTGQASDAGEARIALRSADEIVVEADAAGPALLVLSDAWDAQWRASVDGLDATIVRADFLLRGVRLPAGRHRIVFQYHAPHQAAGRRITWATAICVLLLLGALGLRRLAARREGAGRADAMAGLR